MNIDEELKKIKDLLDKTTTLKSEIIPYFDWGNKVSIKVNEMIDNKKTTIEYYFHIKHCKDRDNYCNAEYFLSCDYTYNLGGGGYGEKYESIDDFKNTRQYKELLEKYGRNKTDEIQTEELTLFDDVDDDEILDVLNNNQMSIFDIEGNNQPTIFNLDLGDNKTEVQIFDGHKYYLYLEDLMSYGIDDYYKKHLSSGSPLLSTIHEELSKLPKYDEYYKKLTEYLKAFLPVKDYETTGWSFTGKCMFINDDNIKTVRANRQQCPVYCYEMYKEEFE